LKSLSSIEKNTRVPELDGIRGIAILMVLVWHYITCQEKVLEQGSLLSMLHFPTKYFWAGVDLFFVLSGFLIGGIILDQHKSSNFLKIFWIKRACRILPVYLLLLGSYFVFKNTVPLKDQEWLFGNSMPWWTYFLFVQNIAMGLEGTFGANYLGITWSLAVEEQFYLLAPIGMLCFGRKIFIYSLVPLILSALAIRIAFPGFQGYVNMPFRMDALLMGVGIAVIYRNPRVWCDMVANRFYCLLLFFLLVLISFLLVLRNDFGAFRFFWFAVVFSGFLILALLYSGSKITFFLRGKVLCFFGAISYGLYMYHQPISGLIHGILGEESTPNLKNQLAFILTIVAAAVSILVAWFSHRFFESYFLRVGKQFSYNNSQSDS
jgi:peptidoglycan/LPS O-acetylase OafA/YrhL